VVTSPTSPVYLRLRASDAPLNENNHVGTLVNGEVEDYRVAFNPTAVTLSTLTANVQSSAMPLVVLALVLPGLLSATTVIIRRRRTQIG
jgi:hypothetical protein